MNEVIKNTSHIIEMLRDLPSKELEFLKKYIDSHLKNDFKEIFHEFIDEQIDFLKESFD